MKSILLIEKYLIAIWLVFLLAFSFLGPLTLSVDGLSRIEFSAEGVLRFFISLTIVFPVLNYIANSIAINSYEFTPKIISLIVAVLPIIVIFANFLHMKNALSMLLGVINILLCLVAIWWIKHKRIKGVEGVGDN